MPNVQSRLRQAVSIRRMVTYPFTVMGQFLFTTHTRLQQAQNIEKFLYSSFVTSLIFTTPREGLCVVVGRNRAAPSFDRAPHLFGF